MFGVGDYSESLKPRVCVQEQFLGGSDIAKYLINYAAIHILY